MNRQSSIRIPIFQSADQLDNPGDKVDYCEVCGKYKPKKDNLGWYKEGVKLKDLEGNISACNICRLVLLSLREYQKKQCPIFDLPSIFTLRCHPGLFLEIKKCAVSASEEEHINGFLDEADLEIFVHPGR